MKSPTLDKIMMNAAGREAVRDYQDSMGATNDVVQYAFWHLDKKRDGKLSDSVDTDSLSQFIEMVVEQVQLDLLTGAARKHAALRRAATTRSSMVSRVLTKQQIARRLHASDDPISRPARTHRQSIAVKWKTVVSRQNKLAEESVDWHPQRVDAARRGIANALIAWKQCVDLPG